MRGALQCIALRPSGHTPSDSRPTSGEFIHRNAAVMSRVVCIDDLKQAALARLDKNALGYYNSGADGEQTLTDNNAAFQRYRLRPRCMVDISTIDLTQTVLGHEVSMPIGVAPTAMQAMAHPEGECATARAAEEMGAVFVLSSGSNKSIEEVADAAPRAIKWFQLYILKDRSTTVKMVQRAEQAGFSAIVLTVDAQVFGKRLADARNGFQRPSHLRLGNFASDVDKACHRGDNEYVEALFDLSVTWDDLSWLCSVTRLPVLVKGVMTPEDAVAAADRGASGVIVSNHGGRQLDGCIATVDALGPVVAAVGLRCPVFMDGGVRRGTDALKALALGACMVFVGRPLLWGLAHDGQRGARLALQLLQSELRLAMGLCGVTKVADVTEDVFEQSERSQL
ncbi:peroxisomal (S)-2-hydroxy-acid oxidase GLO3-like [Pollicipes pollicipes]|uniref:peroxisomal (S)-2-hydroxy-acid oxidase GLO3-like n=1 Tax=Pollicipes pollicipes TaxID=41117 RepID=UPI00188506C3|nr:peroxisomal (S)-2-hydroxy-acid oxidase GLO3-like [Pollicipes pollicipes]